MCNKQGRIIQRLTDEDSEGVINEAVLYKD